MKKTNAARILESKGVVHVLREYTLGKEEFSAEAVAEKLGMPPYLVFKTLLARGDGGNPVLVSIPGGSILDLKALARASGNRKTELVPQKEIRPLTGYERGAVSPLGLKTKIPYFLDESANQHEAITISAGALGLQITLAPGDLIALTGANLGLFGKKKCQ